MSLDTPGVPHEESSNGYEHDYPHPLSSIEKVGYPCKLSKGLVFDTCLEYQHEYDVVIIGAGPAGLVSFRNRDTRSHPNL